MNSGLTHIRPECALFVEQVSARDAINGGSPLYPNAIKHVIASAGLPPKPHGTGLVVARLALSVIAKVVSSATITGRAASQKQRDRAADAAGELLAAFKPLEFTMNAPPPVPREWALEMAAWMNEHVAHAPLAKSRAEKPSDGVAFPLLLALYWHLFGQEPAGGENGSTVRFLKAFYEEMRAAHQVAKWICDIDPEWDRPMLDRLFPSPVEATLRSRMRTFRNAGVEARPVILTLVARLKREMAESASSDFFGFA